MARAGDAESRWESSQGRARSSIQMAGRPVEIAKGIRLWSAKGGLHVGQAFAMWMIPGYLLYRFNTSEAVRGDVEAELPKRPDLPMGGNASNRVTKTTAEQNLNAMLAKVQRGERVEVTGAPF